MLLYLRTSLFDSPAQTLVNTVNTEGVMGKGIAKTFKSKYPEMYESYLRLCESGDMAIGRLMLWRTQTKWILNFPTKTTWRKPSKLDYIEKGLARFSEAYESLGIESISFPPLGCGNGNLSWRDVRPLMERYLEKLPIDIYIHDIQVSQDFVPEHLDSDAPGVPTSFSQFLDDIRLQILETKGKFQTLTTGTSFGASVTAEGDLVIDRDSREEVVRRDQLENTWAILQSGLLTADQFSDEQAKRAKSYLFGVLAELPYVRFSEVQHTRKGNTTSGHALFLLKRPLDGTARGINKQGDLWPSRKGERART